MIIERQLFEGTTIHLGMIDYENDPKVEAKWTQYKAYWQAQGYKPARPLPPERIKKIYEAIEKAAEEKNKEYYFTIRSKEDNRLLGYERLNRIDWAHGFANLWILIGDSRDRDHGYGSEALNLILHFAFNEMNLHRINASVGADNPQAIHFLRKAGFVEEVRRRQALHLDGKYWDLIHMGLLKSEWVSMSKGQEVPA